jgi:hypothetical protein
MKRLLTSAALIPCLIIVGCLKGPGGSKWAGAAGAEQFERLMWQSIHEQKWDEVENHLAPTFVGVSASGQKFDRAGWVQYWKGQQGVDFSLGEVSVQPDGADMVVSYEIHLSVPNSSGLQVLSVWQQLKHGWVLISQAMTPVKSN